MSDYDTNIRNWTERQGELIFGIETRLAVLEKRLAILMSIVGGLTLIILGSVFAVWSRLGEIIGQLAQISDHLR